MCKQRLLCSSLCFLIKIRGSNILKCRKFLSPFVYPRQFFFFGLMKVNREGRKDRSVPSPGLLDNQIIIHIFGPLRLRIRNGRVEDLTQKPDQQNKHLSFCNKLYFLHSVEVYLQYLGFSAMGPVQFQHFWVPGMCQCCVGGMKHMGYPCPYHLFTYS